MKTRNFTLFLTVLFFTFFVNQLLSHPLDLDPQKISSAEVGWVYLKLGFTHILPLGLDHILFVLGLFLLTTNVRSVLVQVTAFTVAHSITLGLALYGIVSLPTSIVEPLI